ncbi:MFS transporter [Jatrophihabitans sp.]|uniref:MFS transporter n=1 Tax=Jatrophihabitans sp. TaxID=1932789 RepID=UPI002F234476
MTSFAAAGRQTFAALANPNYRRFFSGQAISLIGTWMQTVAQSWLVLQLTGSATALGVVVALQTLPVLLLGPYGGVVADRVDKRRLMMALQAMMGLLALVLGVLTVTGAVRLWQVYLLAVLLGLNTCFENPARQAFVLEMVGTADLRNAVSLNSVLVNAARAIGPAIAGLIIATGGLGICFLLNALSFVAVVWSLAMLDTAALQPAPPASRTPGQLRAGLHYVRRTPELAVPLAMMALIGCLAYEFQVVLPVVAKQTFGGGPQVYGFMTAAMGLGAVVGGLWVAARGRVGVRALVNSAAVFGILIAAAAAAPTLPLELLALTLVGAASVGFLAKGNSSLQLAASPSMRGRVMALWGVAFLGSTPIGGPIAGTVSEQFGGRAGLALGAAACLVAAGFGALVLRRLNSPAQRAEVAQPADAVQPADSSQPADAVLPADAVQRAGAAQPDEAAPIRRAGPQRAGDGTASEVSQVEAA